MRVPHAGVLSLTPRQGAALSPMALSPFVLWSVKTSPSPRRRDHHGQHWLTPGQMSSPALCCNGETRVASPRAAGTARVCLWKLLACTASRGGATAGGGEPRHLTSLHRAALSTAPTSAGQLCDTPRLGGLISPPPPPFLAPLSPQRRAGRPVPHRGLTRKLHHTVCTPGRVSSALRSAPRGSPSPNAAERCRPRSLLAAEPPLFQPDAAIRRTALQSTRRPRRALSTFRRLLRAHGRPRYSEQPTATRRCGERLTVTELRAKASAASPPGRSPARRRALTAQRGGTKGPRGRGGGPQWMLWQRLPQTTSAHHQQHPPC